MEGWFGGPSVLYLVNSRFDESIRPLLDNDCFEAQAWTIIDRLQSTRRMEVRKMDKKTTEKNQKNIFFERGIVSALADGDCDGFQTN